MSTARPAVTPTALAAGRRRLAHWATLLRGGPDGGVVLGLGPDQRRITLSRNFLSDRDAFLASDAATLNDVAIAVATRHKTSEWPAAAGQAAQDFYSHHIPLSAYIGNPKQATIDPLDSPLETIPWSMWLTVYYLGIFAFAEAAFVLMALKEYLIDLLHLSDAFLITGREPAGEASATAASAGG